MVLCIGIIAHVRRVGSKIKEEMFGRRILTQPYLPSILSAALHPAFDLPKGVSTPQLENGYGQKLTPVRQAFALRLLS
jgi:hypothetical protein